MQARKSKGLLVDHTNEMVGKYHIDAFVGFDSHRVAVYKSHCVDCGKVIIGRYQRIKDNRFCTCDLIKINNENRFNRVRNKIVKGYKVLGYYMSHNALYYILECISCHKKNYIKAYQLNSVKRCTCQHCDTGRLKGKHDGEIIGDYILEDTGETLKNNRNRMYKAVCMYCGDFKFGQYSDLARRCSCKHKKYGNN